MEDLLQIDMLGGFSLTYKENTIDFQNNRSNKLWMVLAYLLTYRDKQVSQEELIEVLWGDNPIENPVNTLKTIRHRLCSMLDELEMVPGKKMLYYNHGVYAWNKDVRCVLDTDRFLSYCNLGDNETVRDQKIAYYLYAIEAYNGDFLPKFSDELWVMSINIFYHTEFLRVVKNCLTLLKEEERYYDIVTICQKAVSIEPYDETLHSELIQALVNTGAKQSALNHYEKVKEMLYYEYGVNLSEDLMDLYKQIIKENNEHVTALPIIFEKLQEEKTAGAFYCEYALFKEIYRLISRMVERNGQSMYLCLISLADPSSGNATDVKKQSEAMGRLRTTIQSSLRRGDVFTRYSVTQYLILLSSIDRENTEMVLNRIVTKYKKSYPTSQVQLLTSFQPLVIPV